MSIIVGLHWKLSLLMDPLISGYLYLWPPSQNPVYDTFLNSYTNSVFLNFFSGQLQPFSSHEGVHFDSFHSIFLLQVTMAVCFYWDMNSKVIIILFLVVCSFGIILIRISKLSEITRINLLLLQKRQMNPQSQLIIGSFDVL